MHPVANPRDVKLVPYRLPPPPPYEPAASPPAESAPPEPEQRLPSLGRLLFAFLRQGCISFGGRSQSYLQQEFVDHRRWITREHFLEGHALGKMLPGAGGANMAVYVGRALGGPLGSVLCPLPYILPGAVFILALAMLAAGGERPLWISGGMRGASLAAVGLLLSQSLNNAPAARSARFGVVLAPLAFVAHALLGMDLLLVMAIFGGASLFLNRPRRSDA